MSTIQRVLAVAVVLFVGLSSARAQGVVPGTVTLSTAGSGTNKGTINITGSNAPGNCWAWKSSVVTIWITGGTGSATLDPNSINATGKFNVDVGAGLLTSGQTYWVTVQTVFTSGGNSVTILSDPLKATAK